MKCDNIVIKTVIDIDDKKYYNMFMYLCFVCRCAGVFLQKEAKCDGLCRAIYG